jgi:hypothetical protein
MPFLSRALLVLALAGGISAFVASPARGAETTNSEFVIIQEDDVVEDDLYAGAIRIVVDGEIDGDLVTFAAEEVVINGTVTGSVFAIAPRTTVNGQVGGSVRATGSTLEVSGTVGRDVVAAVWSASLTAESSVEGDVVVWAWRADALGSIEGDLTGSQRSLALAGTVAGDVDVSVGRLSIDGPLTVGGDLAYRSSREATGLDQAEVGGAVVHKETLDPNLRVRALSLLGRFMVVLFLTVAALTTAYGWPQRTAAAISAVSEKPIRNWLRGAGVLFAPLIVAAFTGVLLGLAPAAASFPLLVVLIPVMLALAGLSFALAVVAGAPVVGRLGGALFRRLEIYGAILVGSVVVGILWYLPLLGWLVPLVVLPLGLGAWFAAFRQASVSTGESESIHSE